MRILLITFLLIGAILGYGYWHAATHASFHIQLNFKTAAENELRAIPKTEIRFKDSSGQVLANGTSDEQYNFVHLLHPEVGDCHEVEKAASSSPERRTAWQECFAHVATWIPQWADDVVQIDLQTEKCRIQDIPVSISKYNSDWFLWWVPLPHVGGTPYSHYSLTVTVDENDCGN